MSNIYRFVFRVSAAATVLLGVSLAPVNAVSVNTIGDNVTANSGAGFVLMVSLQRNRR